MKHPLRVGQVFRFTEFAEIRYATKRSGADKWLAIDLTRLEFDGCGHHTGFSWTENGEDGWQRKHNETLDLSVDDEIASVEFKVLETAMTGGSTGRDPFPDGHRVIARETGGMQRLVRFYQSGCFTGMREPGDIELVSGPPDALGSDGRAIHSIWDEETDR